MDVAFRRALAENNGKKNLLKANKLLLITTILKMNSNIANEFWEINDIAPIILLLWFTKYKEAFQ